MLSLKLLAAAGLSTLTAACAISPFNRSPEVVRVDSPRPIPPAECMEQAPARETFTPPVLPAQVTTGPALAIALSRAERGEAVAMAALDHIDKDRVADARQDDIQNRCADWSRGLVGPQS